MLTSPPEAVLVAERLDPDGTNGPSSFTLRSAARASLEGAWLEWSAAAAGLAEKQRYCGQAAHGKRFRWTHEFPPGVKKQPCQAVRAFIGRTFNLVRG